MSLSLLNTQLLDRQISNTIEDIKSRVKASRGKGRGGVKSATAQPMAM